MEEVILKYRNTRRKKHDGELTMHFDSYQKLLRVVTSLEVYGLTYILLNVEYVSIDLKKAEDLLSFDPEATQKITVLSPEQAEKMDEDLDE